SASLSPVGDLGYSAIDQIAQFGLSSLKVIYYSEQLFRGYTYIGLVKNLINEGEGHIWWKI
ncbi:hypothetical protein ACQJ2A_25450, partial [Klebsiella quasipneumoniae subsp. similipneumoniae]